MILPLETIFISKSGIPRESGDDPWLVYRPEKSQEVFPARAGMIRSAHGCIPRLLGIPRESGDDPLRALTHSVKSMYSPRERG